MILSKKTRILRPNTTSRKYFIRKYGVNCAHCGDIYKNNSRKIINSSAIINSFAQDVSIKKILHCDFVIAPDVAKTVSDWGHFAYVKYDGTQYINGTHAFAITCKTAVGFRHFFYYLQVCNNAKHPQTMLNGYTIFQTSSANFNVFCLQNYHEDESKQQHIVDIGRHTV
jgi:hypothetical protein